MNAMLPGLITGISLIVAIGAQNAFVLRQGLRRERIWLVVAICTGCDIALILAGVAGIGSVTENAPWALEVLRWGGAAYLMWFAFTSFRSAIRPSGLAAGAPTRGEQDIAKTTLALTLLNPHVYLDTVVMLGSIANQHGDQGRWWFALGACVGSVVWFSLLGFGSIAAARWLAKPSVWRVLDVLIGIVMLALAAKLAMG
ncbi:LysE/ArgO family amino acid transporter [Demetria terragena]|uniref:LysE/ArgO family amino acid transporter n=1 Tax=Demetria terragena TaxID=63959 RepID=UPI0003689FB9|nr:LysE/ArgO family amino acid transporter [Demetria terragena]